MILQYILLSFITLIIRVCVCVIVAFFQVRVILQLNTVL